MTRGHAKQTEEGLETKSLTVKRNFVLHSCIDRFTHFILLENRFEMMYLFGGWCQGNASLVGTFT